MNSASYEYRHTSASSPKDRTLYKAFDGYVDGYGPS